MNRRTTPSPLGIARVLGCHTLPTVGKFQPDVANADAIPLVLFRVLCDVTTTVYDCRGRLGSMVGAANWVFVLMPPK